MPNMENSSDMPHVTKSKISIPVTRNHASRPRLLAALDRVAADGQLMLVVAPSGTGKTALLADWAIQSGRTIAWYRVDVADRDTRTLLAGLLQAIDRALPGIIAEAAAMLERGRDVLSTLDSALDGLEEHPLTLVVDDLHHLDSANGSGDFWDHVFRLRPRSLALILLSRVVPRLGTATIVALGGAAGLSQRDLRFDEPETGALLRAHGLDADQAATLATGSDGWATGVLLLARTAVDAPGPLAGRRDLLLQQLGDQLLADVSPRLRGFLLESAAIAPASSEQTDRLLQRVDSGEYYEEALRRGMFLECEQGLYHYHDLFTDYLVGTLAAEPRAAACSSPRRLGAVGGAR